MKILVTSTVVLLALAPAAFAQTGTSPKGGAGSPANAQPAPDSGNVVVPQGRSAADPVDPTTTSGRPSDGTGTQSMAPSSGNAPSGEPDPGMGRGQK